MGIKIDSLEEQLALAVRSAEDLRVRCRRVAIEANHRRFARIVSARRGELSPHDIRRFSREADEAVCLLGLAAQASAQALNMMRRLEKEADATQEE